MSFYSDFFRDYIQKDYPTLTVRTRGKTPPQLDGIIVACNTNSESIARALTFFSIMGTDMSRYKSVPLHVMQDIVAERRQYLGVFNGELNFWTGDEVSAYGNYRLLTFPSAMSDGIGRALEYGAESVLCETPEASALLGYMLAKAGRTWASGERYTETDMYFDEDALGKGKVYNIQSGSQYTNKYTDERGFYAPDVEIVQALLFNAGARILKNPNTLDFESLRKGSIYVFHAPRVDSYIDDLVRVVFKLQEKNIRGEQLLLSSGGRVSTNRNIFFTYPTNAILYATEEEKTEFRAGYREYKVRLAEEEERRRRVEEMERIEAERQNWIHSFRKYNTDVPTQLLSVRMHNFLMKVVEKSEIAQTLLNLNKTEHGVGYTRNITISKSTQEMTFTPANKETVMTENYRWEKKGRQSGKYGKVLRKVLSEQLPEFKFTDQDLETLVNHLKACADNGEFSIVSGDDIMYWYNGQRYANDDDTGTLGCSCMRHCPDYVELYAKNPDVCKMIILVKDGKLYGRALLWLDKYVDRIYGSDSTIVAFKEFAKGKGYHTKAYQNSDCVSEWVKPNGDHYNEYITIDVDIDCEYFPYADTFLFIDLDGGQIGNDESCGRGAQLRSTDGDIYDDERVYDEHDDCYISSDDAVYLDYISIYTHCDNTRYCEISQEYYLEEDVIRLDSGDYAYREAKGVVYVDEDDVWTLSEDTFVCEYDDNTYASSCRNAVYLDELEMTVMEDNVRDAYAEQGYIFIEETECWVTQKEYEILTENNE